MFITVEAKYENGVLKLQQPLPLENNEIVRVTIQSEDSKVSGRSALLTVRDAMLDESTSSVSGGPVLDGTAELQGEWEMLDMWLDIPRSPSTRTVVAKRGKPVFPRPFHIHETDLTPE